MRRNFEVNTSYNAFWNHDRSFDVVQLNWPEELLGWREPTDLELVFMKRTLERWRKSAQIVVTRHNYHPHYSDTPKYRKLYDIVYSAAHAIVHLGEFSRDEFLSRYSGSDFLENQIQAVIPHHIFSTYPADVGRSAAREFFGLDSDTITLLSFGRVRSAFEKNLVVDAFLTLPRAKRVALIPGWHTSQPKEPVNRIKWAKLRYLYDFRYAIGYVPPDEVGHYFMAADLVLIPRENSLNSGLISLCIKYDCPTIAPDCGNLTEMALSMNCALFDPNDLSTLAAAMEKTISNVEQRPSYCHLRQSLSAERIGQKYSDLYRSLISSSQ